MNRFLVAGAALGVLAGVSPADAVTPVRWSLNGAEGWAGVERESTGIGGDGALRLARAVAPIEGLECLVAWDLLEDGDGVLVATGDAGALFRIDGRGRAAEVARMIDPEITALGRGAGGTILAGATPDGAIFRFDGSALHPLADTPETYVWRILPDGRGGTYVATGNAGKIYRLDRSGTLSLVADPGATHVTGLESFGQTFVFTTESPGRLVELGEDGALRTLHDAEEPELRAPVVDPDGSVYFLANPEKDPGRLYRWSPPGIVQEVWRTPAGFLYDMVRDVDGSLWVTSGSPEGPSAVFRVIPASPVVWSEAAQVRAPQVLSLHVKDGQGYLATGGGGGVFRLSRLDTGAGTATSEVRDAGASARWGALSVEPLPASGSLRVETRTGNTRIPDESWSPWGEVSLVGDRGSISSPPARFLQWRLALRGDDAVVRAVHVNYLTANREPQVRRLEISPLGAILSKMPEGGPPGAVSQTLPGGVRVEFQVPQNRNPEVPASDAETGWMRRYRTVRWEAEDPDGDALRFDLELKAVGESDWKPLRKDLTTSPWAWDSAAVPDGWYALRVIASDHADNPAGERLRTLTACDPFLVDNTAPRVSDLRENRGVVSGAVEDASSSIKRIEISVDGGDWLQVFPTDGIPDMPRETFSLELGTLDAGSHVAMVRAFDQAGNPGTGRIEFRTP